MDLQQKHIDLTKIRFVAFDGAAVFSGIRNGIAANFRAVFNLVILFIRCRTHALQLAVISVADGIPDICKSLSTLKSLFYFINRSSVRLTLFEDVQDIFISKHIKLIQPGDTHWLSNSLAIRSIVHSYQSLLVTLENMYNENNEDSAKALGLYNVLSNQATAFILHTLQSILDILAVLSKSIQTKAADFKRLQYVISSTILRFEELKDYSSIDYVNILETIQKLLLVSSTIRNSSSSISNVQLNIARFEQSTLKLLNYFMIFDMENINDNKDYGDKEMYTIQQHYSSDFDKSIIYEWRTFHTYLLDKKKGGQTSFSTDESIETLPLLLSPTADSLDDRVKLDARTEGEKEADHDSFDSDDDEEDDSFRLSLADKDDDLLHNKPLHFIPLPSTTTSKKRVSKSKQKIPVATRLRFTTDRDEGKVTVILQAEDEDIVVSVDNSTDLAYTRRDGVIVSLLKIQGTKENTVKCALKSINALFIDKQDLQNVDVKKIDDDPRIKAIYSTQ
ncbi:unnamed protein product [Rotaria magnacalcarata]|uniref:Uncharacterized protein n=3 Tax=Rotaria magnacalcarata TaxID=392030 RepID=A0A816LE39_9BILA|nr:unnamed protein product [Rotaria magnacalcarata]